MPPFWPSICPILVQQGYRCTRVDFTALQVQSHRALQDMLGLCTAVQAPLKAKKIIIRSNNMTHTTGHRTRHYLSYLEELRGFSSLHSNEGLCTKTQLLSRIGFARKVVLEGCIFLRRLLDLAQLDSPFLLSTNARENIIWWPKFARSWNGTIFIPYLDTCTSAPAIHGCIRYTGLLEWCVVHQGMATPLPA